MDEPQVNQNPSVTTAPPPPSEVKVRTMRSDLESMAKSGGGMPNFSNVKVAGLAAPQPTQATVARAKSKSNFLVIVIVLIALVVVGVAGWFAYTIFFAGKGSANIPSSGTTAPAAPTTTAATPPTNQGAVPTLDLTPSSSAIAPASPSAPGISFTHISFFKTPADQVLHIAISSAGSETFNQQLSSLLASAKKTASLIEIDATDTAGNAASVNELLAAQNASVISPLTLATDFNPDATFFVYRDTNGFWPGYIIALAPGQSSISVAGSVQQIESPSNVTNIPNFFLASNIGTPSSDGFTTTIISGSSARVLPFFGGTIPTYFAYGWTPDNQYLILSASQAGFAAALQRMGY